MTWQRLHATARVCKVARVRWYISLTLALKPLLIAQVWDMRTLKPGVGIVAASRQPLRDVDWASATRHVLSTVGDDQRLRVWDLR